jgi:hypothetical protein
MNQLNDKIWDKSNKLIPDVKRKLLMIAHKVTTDIATLVKIKDIYFTGSLATYKWTPVSDIDLHVVVDILEKHSDNTLIDYFDVICKLFNSQHNIFIKGYKVEVNLKEKENSIKDKATYDIVHDKWITTPNPNTRSLEDPEVINITKKYQNRIDELITKHGSVEEAKALKKEIKDLRKNGLLEGEGEYSIGNLVFKRLRNTEYLAKIFNYWNRLEDQILSLETFKQYVNTSL